LLDQSVDDTRHAELSEPAIRLGYFHPFDRLRLIGSVEQAGPNVWPMLMQVSLGSFDGHPIDARAAFVAPNPFPRVDEIFPVAHLFHQVFRQSRAFGCWFAANGSVPW
jgi:hypothetical protein